jgi:hypothetical protein
MTTTGDFRWQLFKEPLRVTLARTGTIALVIGGVIARWFGGLAAWPMTTLLALWPSLGGHLVELLFLNALRPRLPVARDAQIAVRVAVWFIGGMAMALGMRMTAMALAGARFARWPAWWLAGLAFIGIELAVHLLLRLRGRPSFFDGRG